MTATAPQPRMLHTMIRVFDLKRSLDFYTRVLGMRVLRQKEYPEGRFTNTFVGYGPEEEMAAIELTYNWDQKEPYQIGTGYGHIALGVTDIYATCDALKAAGAKITRPPGPMKHGTTV
ncbi:MAG: lactoylglutathione lyase, partial [Alphaproteobacteria bacterium]|nr:lactoylglutathione lyase [Alphaproteobacteria bacterium]